MPIGIEAVRSALTAGDCIMVTMRRFDEEPAKQGLLYCLKSTGQAIPAKTMAKLADELQPMDRGLFDDAPQSFILKSEA